MFKRFGVSLSLLTLCGLVLCGCTERTEENDTPLLSEDLDTSFQLIGDPQGSLIPPEEVPVVSVEITRQDAENVWWRLKADPAPKYEDLVVLIMMSKDGVFTDNFFVVIPRYKSHSVDLRASREKELWHWSFSRSTIGEVGYRYRSGVYYVFVPEADVGDYWVQIGDTLFVPVQQGEKLWNDELDRWEWKFSAYIRAVRYWDVYTPDNTVSVQSAESMINFAVEKTSSYLTPVSTFANTGYGMQSILTEEGYVIPHGFQFSYYHVGDEAIITIPNIKEERTKPDAPPDID